jgi:probable F420-dependent oxidoreductase
MRFHQGVAFLETEQLLDLCRASDEMGFAGISVSDHIFFPKQLASRYPYSPYEDGSPIWTPEADWPDVWCLISAMAAVTTNLRFTTSVYIAPARDLYTVAKAVGTAAVISNNRVTLGVGAGWCKEEFVATGQEFHDRGRRLDDMIPALRAIWSGHEGDGWVEYHGPFYDVPSMQMNPSPTAPVPIMVGGISDPALRRMARLSDGFLATGPYTEEEALATVAKAHHALEAEGRPTVGFPIMMALATADVDSFKRVEEAGVTDLLCAPWMFAARPDARDYRSSLDAKLRATEEFATQVIAKMA